MNTIVVSFVRTVVPQIAAVIVLQLARIGFQLDPGPVEQVLTAAIYYLAARLLEESRSPRWGWLLGRPSKPTYNPQGA